MKRSLILTATIAATLLVGWVAASPAAADCGRCDKGDVKGVDDQPDKAKKCPVCPKMHSETSETCAAKKKMCHAHRRKWRAIREAVCVLHPTQGNTAKGVVRFIQSGPKVKVVADIEGLSPNGTHAIHIHQYGDCSLPNGKSAGGHYNPEKNPHALPGVDQRHAGDLGNLIANSQGKAHYEMTMDNICVVGHHNPILGRGVIVHAKEDDGGQPTGNAGSRIACGVIGIANSPANQPPATQPATRPAGQRPTTRPSR